MSEMHEGPTQTPPPPPSEDTPPPLEPDLDLLGLLEGSGRRSPKEIWLRRYGPNAKKPWWKRLLGPFAV
jgi:hypothetical protein